MNKRQSKKASTKAKKKTATKKKLIKKIATLVTGKTRADLENRLLAIESGLPPQNTVPKPKIKTL